MSTTYVPSLNGLRALSITIVILFHSAFRNLGYAKFPGGQLGVNIFFIVSGFLITLLLLEEEKISHDISLKKFYLRRVFRIFPVYYFLLLTYYILQVTHVFDFTANSWFAATTYTEDVHIPKSNNWEMGHLWSLSVEEHFYLLWPIIFKFLKPYRVKMAIFVIVIIPVIRGIEYVMIPDNTGTTVFERADAIMFGCLLAIYYQPISKWMNKFIAKYKFAIFIPFLGLLLSVVMMKIIRTNNMFEIGVIRALGRGEGTISNIFICLIIVVSVDCKNSLWYRLLNFKIVNYTGKLSYSLYIWQQLFFSFHIGRLIIFPLNIVCIIIVSIISYHLVERPFLRLKSKFEVERVPMREAA